MQGSAETRDRTAGEHNRTHDRHDAAPVLGVGLTALLAVLLFVLVVAIFYPPQHAFRGLAAYLPLHTAMETFAIVVSMLVFTVGWNAHSEERAGNIVLLSCAFLAVGLLDFAHVLSYPGMADFVTPSGPEKAINFWLAARGLAALALLAAAVLPCRPFAARGTRYWLLAASMGITALAYWVCLFHQDELPATFIAGRGLTPFKIGAEYALIALYGLAAAVFFARLRVQRVDYLRQLFVASCVIALSELFFTLYGDVTDSYNLLGHVYKVIAYFLIYQALFGYSLEEPYQQLQLSRQAVRENQERFRNLASVSSDWYWEQDAEYRFTFMSGGVQGIGKRRWELPMTGVSAADWEQHKLTLEQHLPFHDFVYQTSGEAGRLCWLSISGVPVFDSEGNFKGYRGTCKDISERKVAEAETRSARERLQLALEGSSLALVDVDVATGTVYLSAAWAAMMGEKAQSTVTNFDALMKLVHPEDVELVKKHFCDALTGRNLVYDLEHRVRTRSGEWKWIHSHGKVVERDGNGMVVRMAGTNADITGRKRAEVARRESEERLSGIVQTSMHAIIMVDEDMNIVLFNPAAEEIFGYPRADVAGVSLDRLIPERFRHAHATHIKAFGASTTTTRKMSERGIIKGLRANGEEFPVEATISHQTLNGKKLYTMILSDITERRRAEEAQAQLAGIVETCDDAIVSYDPDGTLLSWNAAAEKILGYTAAEMIGRNISALAPPERMHESQHSAWLLQHGKRVPPFESERVTKEGRLVQVQVSTSAVRDPAGNVVRIAAILRDVTERKQAEEARAWLAAIVENSNDAIFTRALDGTILSWNAGAERMLGYTAAEAIGRPISFTLPPGRQPNLARNNEKVLRGETVVPHESNRLTRDGRVIDVLTSHSPLKDKAGNIAGISVILHDITARLEAEKQFRLSAAVFETIQEAIIVTDASNRIILVNPSFTRITGYTPDEVIGKSPRILSSGMQDEAFYKSMWASINDTGRWQGEIWDRRKNGEVYCEWLSISTVKDSQGETLYHAAIFSDITERKQAEGTRAQLAAVVENATVAIFTRTLDGIITSWNAGAEKILGYTAAEAVGRHDAFTLPPGRPANLARNNEGLLRGEVVARESNRLTKDGRVVDVLTSHSPIKDGAGNVTGASIILQNITALKQAEAAMRESEERFRAAFEQAGVGMGLRGIDPRNPRWLRVNQKLCDILGYTREELLQLTSVDITPPEERDVAIDHNEKLLCGEFTTFSREKRYVRKDGRIIWANITLTPVSGPDGRPTHVISVIEDITEHKRAEQEILKLNAELEQRVVERTQQLAAINKELEAFSYSVSHDLRAPLRGIDGFSQMLLKKYANELDETGNDYLQRIRRASVRMGELIDDLLQLSRVSRSQIRAEPVDLSRLARSILAELQERESERKIVTEVQDGIEVSADPRLLRIALENLLGNAWKFTEKNREAKIRFDARQQDGELIISVKDNGAGFNTKYAHKLFGAFQRLHGAAEFEGTGIGLATVQRIIHLHGGRVWADAAVDKGATFYFAIPRATRNNVTTTPQGEAA